MRDLPSPGLRCGEGQPWDWESKGELGRRYLSTVQSQGSKE